MRWLWPKANGKPVLRLDRLSPHLLRDLNLPADAGFFCEHQSELGTFYPFHHFETCTGRKPRA